MDYLIAAIFTASCLLIGNALGDQLTVIDCAKKGTARLNGVTIECTVQREGQL